MRRVPGLVVLCVWGLVSCAPAAYRSEPATPVDLLRRHYMKPRALPDDASNTIRRQKAIDRLGALRIYLGQPHVGPALPTAVPASTTGPCVWQSAGPTNVSGRVTSIAVDESDPSRMFVATVGGVWRSLDGGLRWVRVTDQSSIQAGVFGAVAITPGNRDEIFIGGGDPNLFYYTGETRAGGPGLWRSTSSGDPGSWTSIGPPELASAVVFRIRVDPAPSHNVYAAASNGLWLGTRPSATGSFTWARLGGFNAPCGDVAVDFSVAPPLVYAAAYEGTPTFTNGIWKHDGTSWRKTSSGVTTSQAGFIALALARNNPKVLYAKVEKASNGRLMGVYKTETAAEPTGGNAWTNVMVPEMDDCVDGAGSGYTAFNCVVEVDPLNEKVVYVGCVGLFHSPDGGATWSSIGDSTDPFLHDDIHAIALVGTSGTPQSHTVFVGNDGGLDRAAFSSASWYWEDIGHGINATEYYYLATQQATASLIAGGTQDNGSPITYGNRSWYGDRACDGSYVGVEGANGCTFYQVCYTGVSDVRVLRHVVPGFAGTNTIVRPNTPVPLCPPIATHPRENGKALAGGCPASGAPTLMSTTNGVDWIQAKGGTSAFITFPSGSELWALGIGSASSFQTYYVGFVVGVESRIWSTHNAGANWNQPAAVGAGVSINGIAVDEADPLRAFAALGGNGDVQFTSDGGVTWSSIRGTGPTELPPTPVTGVAIDPWDADVVYVSTDIGVFRGKVSSAEWGAFDQGLPNGVDVNDIVANRSAGTLMIGTMGYGAFVRDIRPGSLCRVQQALIRDNVFDRGSIPSPTNLPDPEHPIEDLSRPITTTPSGYFYKPDDTAMGKSYWWSSTDIRVEMESASKTKNQVDVVDHVALEGCPVEVMVDECPAGTIVDRSPVAGQEARVLVQVTNRGTAPLENLRITALWADATTSLPLVPLDFWSATFPPTGACGPLSTGPWRFVDPVAPCRTVAIVRPEYPEVVEFSWVVPADAPAHSCIIAMVESADDPIDPMIRSGNERRPWILVPQNSQIGLRNLHVVDGVAGTTALSTAAATALAAASVSGLDSLLVWNPTPDLRPFDLQISRASMRANAKLGVMLPLGSDSLRLTGVASAPASLTADQRRAVRSLGVDTTKVHWITHPEATIEGVVVTPGGSRKLALFYDSGSGPPLGTTRFVVAAVRDRIVYGGSTYLLRTRVRP